MLPDKLPAKPPTLDIPDIAPEFTTPFRVTSVPVPIIPPTLFSPVTLIVFFTFSITVLFALPTTAPTLSVVPLILPEIRLKLRIVELDVFSNNPLFVHIYHILNHLNSP